MPEQKYYWLGNCAKIKIIDEILKSSEGLEKVIIFDYGCGLGGDWPIILEDFKNIELIGYEPIKANAENFRERLKGKNGKVLTDDEFKSASFKADYIVSFSVFEHVFQKDDFLKYAMEHLDEKGIFYLNYDDGHFRLNVELDKPNKWYAVFGEWKRNSTAKLKAKFGSLDEYQERVIKDEVDDLIKKHNFEIDSYFYSNLGDLKGLAKTIPELQKQEFASFWLDIENKLNKEFNFKTVSERGDDCNLWRNMVSRTLRLKISK